MRRKNREDVVSLSCLGFGAAKTDIGRKAWVFKDEDKGLILWGVGIHGGNPSRKNLKDVARMIEKGEIAGEKAGIIYAYPEEFFSEYPPISRLTALFSRV